MRKVPYSKEEEMRGEKVLLLPLGHFMTDSW